MRRARHADGRCDVRHEQARRVRTPEVTRIRLEIGRGRVERDRDVGRLLDREPARPRVEGIEGRRPVLVEELLRRGERHERRLDLARRRSSGGAPAPALPRPRRAGSTSTSPGSPGRARRRASVDVPASGVLPARICTPGAVMSGLLDAEQLGGPPRELKGAIRSPCTAPSPPGRERRGDAGMRARGSQDLAPRVVLEMIVGNEVVVGVESLQRQVVEDHPDAAALRDVEALLGAGVHAAPAERRSCRRRRRPAVELSTERIADGAPRRRRHRSDRCRR